MGKAEAGREAAGVLTHLLGSHAKSIVGLERERKEAEERRALLLQ